MLCVILKRRQPQLPARVVAEGQVEMRVEEARLDPRSLTGATGECGGSELDRQNRCQCGSVSRHRALRPCCPGDKSQR